MRKLFLLFQKLPYACALILTGLVAGLLAGIVGELFMRSTQKAAPIKPARQITLVVDVSGSMASAGKLDKVKEALIQFVGATDLTKTKIALVSF